MSYWLPSSVSLWASYVIAWRLQGTEEAIRRIWKRVAYATRYGRIGLGEAMNLGEDDLQDYIEALGEIVAEENKSPSTGSFQNT